MKQLPRISEGEWQVMKALWARSPQTANEVVDEVADANAWSPRTVKTLLNRLVRKGALGFKQEGRVYLYHPQVSETACARAESRSLLKRVYGGAFAPMLATLIESNDLSKEDIDELRRILNQEDTK